MTLSYRPPLVLLAPLLAFAVALAAFALQSRSPASSPPAVDEGVGALSAAGSTAQRVRVLQTAARRRPRDAKVWGALGLAYYQRVRETGDFSFYNRADRVLRRALTLDPRNVDATVGRATVALARHEFSEGERWALRARSLAPESTSWAAGLVDAQVELGRYATAARTLQAFVDRKPNLASYARVSYLRELRGDVGGAVSAMRLAASAGGDTPESVAYVQTLLGGLEFLRGRLVPADRAYRLALARVPSYPLASAGLAQVDAARGRTAAAERRLRGAIARYPLPQFVVALGELELATGRRARARRDLALVDAERRLLAAGGVNTDADIARYEADFGDPARGVRLARAAWAQAPSVRSADVLGWALSRAGSPGEGLPWMRRALALGSADPLLLYHAGITARDAGDRRAARRWLRSALAGNPRFSPLFAPRARRALERLG